MNNSKIKISSTINGNIYNSFKNKCVSDNTRMNDIIEALMFAYANGQLKIKKSFELLQPVRKAKSLDQNV